MALRVNRRDFASRATAGAAGVVGFLYPGATTLAQARGARLLDRAPIPAQGVSVQRLSGPDPTYGEGRVTSLVSSTTSLVTTMVLVGPSGSRSVSMMPTDVVWKELLGTPTLINSGDWVILKGAPQADGSLAAQSGMIFVNIARRDGVAMATSATGITLHHPKNGQTEEIGLSSALEVINQSDGSGYAGGVRAIPEDTPIGAVGITLPDGSFRATRVWVVG